MHLEISYKVTLRNSDYQIISRLFDKKFFLLILV